MSDLQHADRLMQEAGILFRDNKSIMRSSYIEMVEDRMLCAKEFRQDVETKSGRAQAKQVRLYFERAQMALDAVNKAIENAS